MAHTRAEIRQRVGYDLREMIEGSVTASTITSLSDASLADALASEETYEGAWVLITSGTLAGQQRRVASYVPATGELAVSRNFPSNPAGSVTFEVHTRVEPNALNRMINKVLERIPYLADILIEVVSGQRTYSLAAYTDIVSPEQVREVEHRVGDDTYGYVYRPYVGDWEVRDIDGELTLALAPKGDSNDYIRVVYTRPYEALTTDADETDCPIDMLAAGVRAEAYLWLSREAPADDAVRYLKSFAQEQNEFRRQLMRHAPRPQVRAYHRSDTGRGLPYQAVE
jgi:hypothetical protein